MLDRIPAGMPGVAEWRQQIELLEAGIRFLDTGEPQPVPGGRVTGADPETGSISVVMDSAMERILIELTYEPST
jgi:hypothetical protein